MVPGPLVVVGGTAASFLLLIAPAVRERETKFNRIICAPNSPEHMETKTEAIRPSYADI